MLTEIEGMYLEFFHFLAEILIAGHIILSLREDNLAYHYGITVHIQNHILCHSEVANANAEVEGKTLIPLS